jgi:hypothetical protein
LEIKDYGGGDLFCEHLDEQPAEYQIGADRAPRRGALRAAKPKRSRLPFSPQWLWQWLIDPTLGSSGSEPEFATTLARDDC